MNDGVIVNRKIKSVFIKKRRRKKAVSKGKYLSTLLKYIGKCCINFLFYDRLDMWKVFTTKSTE